MARLMSTPRPLRAILMRSASALMAPCAQQLPQYCGRCWLRLFVRSTFPSTFPHEKLSGSAESSTYSCGLGLLTLSRVSWPGRYLISLKRSPVAALVVVSITPGAPALRGNIFAASAEHAAASSAAASAASAAAFIVAVLILDGVYTRTQTSRKEHKQTTGGDRRTHSLPPSLPRAHSRRGTFSRKNTPKTAKFYTTCK